MGNRIRQLEYVRSCGYFIGIFWCSTGHFGSLHQKQPPHFSQIFVISFDALCLSCGALITQCKWTLLFGSRWTLRCLGTMQRAGACSASPQFSRSFVIVPLNVAQCTVIAFHWSWSPCAWTKDQHQRWKIFHNYSLHLHVRTSPRPNFFLQIFCADSNPICSANRH